MFLHISTSLTKTSGNLGFVVDFLQQYYKNLHVNLLCLASLHRINALETMPDILFEFNRLSDINK